LHEDRGMAWSGHTATHPGKPRQGRPAPYTAAEESVPTAEQVLAVLAAEALEDDEAED